MVVVSDTTPLLAFLDIGRIELLQLLYQTLYVPTAVYQEINTHDLSQYDWIKVVQVEDEQLLPTGLDRGEAEAIALALSLRATTLLIDERKGRTVAKSQDIPIMGSIGVVMALKLQGHLESVQPLLDDFRSKSNFWIGEALYEWVLAQMSEG